MHLLVDEKHIVRHPLTLLLKKNNSNFEIISNSYLLHMFHVIDLSPDECNEENDYVGLTKISTMDVGVTPTCIKILSYASLVSLDQTMMTS